MGASRFASSSESTSDHFLTIPAVGQHIWFDHYFDHLLTILAVGQHIPTFYRRLAKRAAGQRIRSDHRLTIPAVGQRPAPGLGFRAARELGRQ